MLLNTMTSHSFVSALRPLRLLHLLPWGGGVSLLALLLLSGCAALEMPENGTGTDEMKLSPCACAPIPYNSEGYQWLG